VCLCVCVSSMQVFQKNKAKQCKERPGDSMTFVEVSVMAMKGQGAAAPHRVKLANLKQHSDH